MLGLFPGTDFTFLLSLQLSGCVNHLVKMCGCALVDGQIPPSPSSFGPHPPSCVCVGFVLWVREESIVLCASWDSTYLVVLSVVGPW